MIATDALLTLSKDVIVRRDAFGVLLFQVRTDEMYFVPHAAAALLRLVDGSRTLVEIGEAALNLEAEADRAALLPAIESLFSSLAERQVVEVWA